jgi:putative lipoprotein
MVGSGRAGPSGAVARLIFVSLVSLALWLTACGGNSSSDPHREVAASVQAGGSEASDLEPPESPQLLRGLLVLGHEVRSFKPCDSEQDLWVMDETGGDLARIYEDLTSAVYQELYTVLSGEIGPPPSDGFGVDYAGSIRVVALSHAAPESHACNEDLSGIKIRASGNEPFWRVDIREEEILLSELGSEDRRFSFAPSSVQSDGPRHFRGAAESAAGAAAGASIEIVIEERACRDSMSGAYFSFSVRVEVDGRELDGCARQGW